MKLYKASWKRTHMAGTISGSQYIAANSFSEVAKTYHKQQILK